MQDFDEVIRSVTQDKLREAADPRWAQQLARLLPANKDRVGFVEWATHHPKWRFNVADVTANACAKPSEAAIIILSDIVAELLDEE